MNELREALIERRRRLEEVFADVFVSLTGSVHQCLLQGFTLVKNDQAEVPVVMRALEAMEALRTFRVAGIPPSQDVARLLGRFNEAGEIWWRPGEGNRFTPGNCPVAFRKEIARLLRIGHTCPLSACAVSVPSAPLLLRYIAPVVTRWLSYTPTTVAGIAEWLGNPAMHGYFPGNRGWMPEYSYGPNVLKRFVLPTVRNLVALKFAEVATRTANGQIQTFNWVSRDSAEEFADFIGQI